MKKLLAFCLLLGVACAVAAGAAAKPDSGGAARAASQAFFEENAKREGVVSLPSGLQYRVLSAGSGKKPRSSDMVTIHYRGKTPDGQEVDSSYDDAGPAKLRVSQTMPGWRQALVMMQEGAKWELFIPPGLGYTKQRGTRYTRRGKLSTQALIFQLELLEVHKVQAKPAARFREKPWQARAPSSQGLPHVFVYLMGDGEPATEPEPIAITTERLAASEFATPRDAQQEDGDQARETVSEQLAQQRETPPPVKTPGFFAEVEGRGPVVSLPNGLKYRVLKEGRGAAPAAGDTVTVHYRCSSPGGEELDSSYRSGEPARFRLDQAIPGWQEVLQRMPEGASWELYIPPELGYREPGALAGRALVFAVELLSVTVSEPPRGEQARAAGEADQPRGKRTQGLVIRLPDGLSYRVVRNGRGLSPLPGDTLTVEYREKPPDGAGEGSRPPRAGQATFQLDWVIPAWRSLFRRMEEGARWEVQVPGELVRNTWGPQPGAPVTLEVELLSVSAASVEGIALASMEVMGAQETGGEPVAADVAANQMDLGGGVSYRLISEGSGDRPDSNHTLRLRYNGTLRDARGFGRAYHGAGHATLRLDATAAHWQKVLRQMRKGSRAAVYLPSELLPGIWAPPGGQVAMLEVELLDVQAPQEAR